MSSDTDPRCSERPQDRYMTPLNIQIMSAADCGEVVEYTIEKLVHAVQWGDAAYVESAIEGHGMSADSVDGDQCSLLHWAAINNRIQIVQFLITKHVNINVVGGNNKEIPLQWALRCQHCAPLVCILLAEESNIKHKSTYGCDALFVAVQCNQVNAAFILLNAGADPNTVDKNGDTPLYWVLKKYTREPTHDGIEMLRLLLRFKASVTHTAADGGNAIHILAAAPAPLDMSVAHLIYLAGDDAMLEAKNRDNCTPYNVAVNVKSKEMVRFLWDADMYKRFPYYLPVVTTALSFSSLFLCLHIGGWFYGMIAFVPLFLLGETLSQNYIVSGGSRVPCGMAWAIIGSAIVCYYVLLRHHFNSILVDALAAFSSLAIPYTLVKTMGTLPLHMVSDSADARNRLVEKIVQRDYQLEDFKLCTTCLIDKTLASMHCGKCNLCVVSMDHHCPFVCNCVGRGNRRMFVMFLLAASSGCALFVVLSLFIQHTVFCADAVSRWGHIIAVQQCMLLTLPGVDVLTWVTGCTSVWIFGIFLGQMGLIASETTTFEVMKRGNQGVDGFSKKGLRNILMFFTSGTYSIAAPKPGSCGSGGAHSCPAHNNSYAALSPSSSAGPGSGAASSAANGNAAGTGASPQHSSRSNDHNHSHGHDHSSCSDHDHNHGGCNHHSV